ncbi:MAG TPA: Gfo/Idh/MocA family oxidoreductase [Bryobacteraceae bacterium]|nr:Gfo/Idh/MocA family oxidoreductase [Bryobacteraceae bacterium]
MKRILLQLSLAILPFALPAASAPPKIAVIGLLHSHVWTQLPNMVRGDVVQLVGVAESHPELVAEAKKLGVADNLFFDDYLKMLDQVKPDFVWAFVENNRHLEIVNACAPRKVNVIFEKPLASTAKDAEAIRQIANKNGIYVMTNYQMAWWAANYTARKLAETNALGKVYRLRGVVGHGGPGSEGPRNSFFFAWLTDPVKNGAGALMDFGCYNALWSLWYMGKPQTVYARADHLQPERFPKVEDNATLVLGYKDGVGIFEGSWDLPRSYQDLEVFGRSASMTMVNGKVEMRKGRGAAESMTIDPLPKDRASPLAYMANAIQAHQPPEGLVALDINVQVVEIIEAAKESIRVGKPVTLK